MIEHPLYHYDISVGDTPRGRLKTANIDAMQKNFELH